MSKIGIDLGTSNTVACLQERILKLGKNREGRLPSVVAFLPNGRVATGAAARRRRALDGENTIFSSKRIIGRRFSDAKTQQFRENYSCEIVDAGGDRPAFKTRAGLHSPVDIASILLDEISGRLNDLSVDLEVVLTVPTGFTPKQREETITAGLHSGLPNLQLVDEASATAFAYHADPDICGPVAVYDLGGGTFDFAILDCDHRTPRVISQASDLFLGGDYIDQNIARWASLEVLKQHNWDLSNYADVAIRLLGQCEEAKIRLASAEETRIDLSQVDPECPASLEGLPIRRSVLAHLCLDLVQRTPEGYRTYFGVTEDGIHGAWQQVVGVEE